MPGLIALLFLKTAVLIAPLAVVFLAFRRLVLSRSANAWLYASSGLFALVTTLGLVPWALGTGNSHPVFFVFAAMVPTVWYGVVLMCNAARTVRYDIELEHTFGILARLARTRSFQVPLILENPEWPDVPAAVFRHTPRTTKVTPEPLETDVKQISQEPDGPRTILEVARSMRCNSSSEGRRIKLLPGPRKTAPTELPFLKSAKPA